MSPASPGKRTVTAHTASLKSFVHQASRVSSAIAFPVSQAFRMIFKTYRLRFS
jgi:hypothetical protein